MSTPRNPYPTVDVVVATAGGIVLVERKNPPHGWALPGGFIDYGERVEDAARREVREETGLDVELVHLLGVYSDPSRDPRHHTMTVVYVGRAEGVPRGGDDAARAEVFDPRDLPGPLCFDHDRVVEDYLELERTGRIPAPSPPRP
jgi:8-oxo-dGTP diphosphatase